MTGSAKKKYYDNVFGYIRLNEAETEVVNTPIFQRLHFIKQTGLAHLVFPGALHSRFSHSLGVFHIMCKMLQHIDEIEAYEIEEDDKNALRMAALLHDIGHFPLSHAIEKAVEEHSKKERGDELHDGEDEGKDDASGSTSGQKLHEEMSALMVCKWTDLAQILKRHEIDGELVARVITGTDVNTLYNMLLHSELDADRLDYLIRDSQPTGVTYGRIELDHIIDKLRVQETDSGYVLGVHEGDTRSAEHYVLARYFMYAQVINNPRLVFLEEMVKRIAKYMINIPDDGSGLSEWRLYSEEEFKSYIETNDFHKVYDYNDNQVLHSMRQVHDKLDPAVKNLKGNDYSEDAFVNDAIKVVLSGWIPEPCAQKEIVGSANDREVKLRTVRRSVHESSKEISNSLGVSDKRMLDFYPCSKLSKVRWHHKLGEEDRDKSEQDEAIRVISDTGEKPTFLMEEDSSILNSLNDKYLQAAYVFALQVHGKENEELKNRLKNVNLDAIDRVK